MSRPSPRRPRRGASARAPALTLTHVDSDVGRGARPARPSGPTHQVRLPDVPRRGRAAGDVGPYQRFRPQIPTTDPGHRFRPKISATGSDHRFRPPSPTAPPVCCVIRPRSRNKSRPSSCVPFRSEIARRHAGGPRLSRPSPRRPRRGASARAPALTLTHVDSDVGRGARPARPSGPTHQVRLPDVPRRGRAAGDVGPYHRFRPQIPTTDSDHRSRPQVPTTDSDQRFRPQIPTTDPDHRPRPPPCVLRDPATFPQQVATFQLRPVPK